MTFAERVQAVAKEGFTDRQAGFLVTVMLHSGVCVRRQYCAYARIAHGQKNADFFAALIARKIATSYAAAHRRAHIYHLHSKPLYAAIGEPNNRNRKPVTLARAIERLMVLDTVLGEPRPLAPIDALLEQGKVLALNFPVGMNPGLARILGVMLKLDFQRAVLQRIPQITAAPQGNWRDLLFVCDEYHAFATVGETDPTGDERTFALSRQARLIPIVATQSISSLRSALPGEESWRTLLQCFRTKLFLATSDEFTARNAAELCGRSDRLKAHYSVSESGRDAYISLLTGRPTSGKQSLSASKSYAPHHEYIFSPRIFTQLQNAQAIALPYDGINPLPAQYCYLKPHYLDVQTSYFDHVERGAL